MEEDKIKKYYGLFTEINDAVKAFALGKIFEDLYSATKDSRVRLMNTMEKEQGSILLACEVMAENLSIHICSSWINSFKTAGSCEYQSDLLPANEKGRTAFFEKLTPKKHQFTYYLAFQYDTEDFLVIFRRYVESIPEPKKLPQVIPALVDLTLSFDK
jgi:hypothetical protein